MKRDTKFLVLSILVCIATYLVLAFIAAGLYYLTATAAFGHSLNESAYRDAICDHYGGISEYRLEEGSRVDCYLPEYGLAMEAEFQTKWAEAIGQSLFYAAETESNPAVLLITDKDGNRYVTRFHTAASGLGITLFIVDEHYPMAKDEAEKH